MQASVQGATHAGKAPHEPLITNRTPWPPRAHFPLNPCMAPQKARSPESSAGPAGAAACAAAAASAPAPAPAAAMAAAAASAASRSAASISCSAEVPPRVVAVLAPVEAASAVTRGRGGQSGAGSDCGMAASGVGAAGQAAEVQRCRELADPATLRSKLASCKQQHRI